MLAALGAAASLEDSRPIFAFAAFSFLLLIVIGHRHWTPQRDFGWANCVTALRLGIILVMALTLQTTSNDVWGFLALFVFVLDGLDGWLARMTRSVSSFGAHFDMETDALLVAVLVEASWQRTLLGTWVLVPGALRYIYILFSAAVTSGAPEMPRSLFGRVAFSAVVLGLALVFLLPQSWGRSAAWVGACLLGVSFTRSFVWAWAHRVTIKSRQLT